MTPLCTDSRGAAAARSGNAPRGARGGFALLITLALLALAVVLLASLVTLGRIETVVSQREVSAARARQNALLGLQLAVGRLQAAAGGDRRITARADLLSATMANPWWTGVWGAAPAPLTWLVSGNEVAPLAATPDGPPPADPAPDNGVVWLLRTPVGAPIQRVKLPAQPLRGTNLPGFDEPRIVGHYAWWVGDEGVKAKFNLVNPAAGAAPGTPESQVQFRSAQQAGLELLDPGFAAYAAAKGDTAAGAALRDRLGRVRSPNQVPYADPGFGLATLRDHFHDLTTWSFGLVANAREGGLKLDLTRGTEPDAPLPAGQVFPGGPDWNLVRSYCGLRASFVDGRWRIPPRAHAPPQHGVHPVVLLAQVVWGADRAAGRLRLLLRPLVVLANPYDVALAPADYRLVWRQSGALELRNPPEGEDPAVAAGTAAELLGEDPQFLIPGAGFLPGEARAFTLPAGADGEVPYVPGVGVVLGPGADGPDHAFFDLAAAAHPTAEEMAVRVGRGAAGFV